MKIDGSDIEWALQKGYTLDLAAKLKNSHPSPTPL